ncbi:U-box domain-containing protein 8-like [Arachis stenosperma]|uniref:U-box domain-containing protein 8-like n=1 Tax=Arachis stenosperma TaxID=217475 RepID=UPI0025AD8738|nr:U-box domain-containing protein 8-like [Arachis stenosperma]
MTDPVILATGQTYDRAYIQRWLNEGHRTCPQTQQVLSQAPLFIAVLPSAHVATTVSTLRHFPAMKLMEAVLCNVFETVLKIFERKSSAFAD